MAEITIPYAELIDAVAAIDRRRSDHPERDNDPATKGIKLGSQLVMSGSGRFTHDPNAAFGGSITIREGITRQLSLRNLPGMGSA